MRVPSDPPAAPVRAMRRYQVGVLIAIIVFILLLVVLQTTANFFTNYLWYRSVAASAVWRSMVSTKLELGGLFTGVFFVACWMSLWVVDRIAPRALFMAPELELVRRYQTSLGRHRGLVRTVVSFVVALAVGAGTNNQWQHWLLFLHSRRFNVSDPLFHRDVGYYVFKLPFISFLVDWTQLALFVLLIVSAIGHYLNGGLRFSGPAPRVDPRTTAHLSAILAALALLRAVAYFYVDRYTLPLSSNGIVAGATYTDVHVRLPALELLAVVALAAFVLLVYNVYHRSWLLPAVGVGLWALVALTVGVIFPAAVQWLQVNPSQSTAELPYIARNISATRDAMGLSATASVTFNGNTRATAADVLQHNASFQSVDLWDTATAAVTTQKIQSYKSYYSISGTAIDRYELGTGASRTLTPVVISAREVAAGQLTRQTWVNTHLQFTHGYGVVLAPANQVQSSGIPAFDIKDVPPVYLGGAPQLSQPDVYFGPGMSGYVVVDTKQAELDYELPNNSAKASHYNANSGGGIKIGGFWTRAAFALRFHDFNLLISHLITPSSRIMFVQDIRARVQRAAPFLSVDANPYPIVDNGQIEWVVDAYATSSYYPYGQPADTSDVSASSALGGNFNYVRDAVKAVVNAYTGKITFYAMDPSDPVLQAWESAFPGMFHPRSQMDATLSAHLRYPQDLLTIQAAMFGLYHVTSASEFYGKENAWAIAQTGGSVFSPTVTPYYELLQLPDQNLSFDAVVPMQPNSATTNRSQTLTSFLVAPSSSTDYGQLAAYEIPGGTNVPSLALVNSEISSNHTVSQAISLLDQHGSQVLLGPTLLIPVDSSVVWIRCLFVSASANVAPTLREVIVDYGGTVSMQPTLLGSGGALAGVFGPTVSTIGTPGGKTSIPTQVRLHLALASQDYQQAQAARAVGNVELYIHDLAAAGSELATAYKELQAYDKSGGKHGSSSSNVTGSTGSTGVSGSSGPGGTSGTGSKTGSTFSGPTGGGAGAGASATTGGGQPSASGSGKSGLSAQVGGASSAQISGGDQPSSGVVTSTSVTTTTVDNRA